MNELIRLEGITKKFGEHLIIPTLDLTINDGEFVTLLGPSGCGKTTLLRMIAGLETPTTGKVILDGKDITKLPPYKRNVNMVFQNYALFPHMTVTENIHFGLKMQGVPNDEAKERINQVLYLTQLEQFAEKTPAGTEEPAARSGPHLCIRNPRPGRSPHHERPHRHHARWSHPAGRGSQRHLPSSEEYICSPLHRRKQFLRHWQRESNFFDIGSDTYALRPEKLNLCPEDEEGADHPEPKFFGTVVDIVFYGTIDKVFIRLDNTNQTVIAYQYFDDVHRWQADDRVGIWWYDRDGVKVEKE